jgi:hypothetical protein
VRASLPGHLVLGQGFHAFVLVCYTLGVALGVTLEKLALAKIRQRYRRHPAT